MYKNKFKKYSAGVALFLLALLLAPNARCLYFSFKVPSSHQTVFLEVLDRTWKCLEMSLNPTSGLPSAYMQLTSDHKISQADYSTGTDVGLMLMVIPAARDLGYLDHMTAISHLNLILDQLAKMQNRDGLFSDNFKVQNGETLGQGWLSSQDNAWLAAGLWAAANVKDIEVSQKAKKIYQAMHFTKFYDPEYGQMRIGYSDAQGLSTYHHPLLCTEARLISIMAIAKGEVESEHWFRIYRALPATNTWQQQTPKFANRQYQSMNYQAGYYEVKGMHITPSWGGSLPEFLMTTLIIPEQELAYRSLGANNETAVQLQKKYCLEEMLYPVWGLAPCAIPNQQNEFKYGEFGYPVIGSKGYADKGVVTPYASLLAVEIDPAGVYENTRQLRSKFPQNWTEYGFLDSVNVMTKEVAPVYVVRHQAMIFLALHNYLTQGNTRQQFYTREISQFITPLLQAEQF